MKLNTTNPTIFSNLIFNLKGNLMRRYDVDSIRIIALILLIFYHISISFQTWALQISFIKNDDTLEFIWVFMMLINIWRIPILFIVSGMGI